MIAIMSMALSPTDFNRSMGISSIPGAFPLARDSKADLTSSFVTCGSWKMGGVCIHLSWVGPGDTAFACTLSTVLSLDHPQ